MSHHHEHDHGPDDDGRRVEVVGTGEASATPDVVRLRIALTARAGDVAAALRATGALVTAVGAAVRAQAVDPADVASTGAHVQPHWDRDGQRITGYEAGHQLTLVVRDLDRLDPVVDAVAQAAGDGLRIDDIGLEVADASALRERARAAAFADARAKAEQYAVLAGAALGPVLAVAEGGARVPGPRPMAREMVAAASASMPVEAGQYGVSASVAVAFALVTAPTDRSTTPE
ncbi:SIMPL domain-containing protein [Lapillicoccus jejuensis]|nr:SIMPL domain-containing protein [Lapillicoccus jejuensis]